MVMLRSEAEVVFVTSLQKCGGGRSEWSVSVECWWVSNIAQTTSFHISGFYHSLKKNPAHGLIESVLVRSECVITCSTSFQKIISKYLAENAIVN